MVRFGSDGKAGTLSALMEKVNGTAEKIGIIRESGDLVNQVRIHKVLSKNTYFAYFVRFRNEIPLVSQRESSSERPPKLGPDEEVIEKNHFCLFSETLGREIVAYQTSFEGSDISALSNYFTELAGNESTITLDEIIDPDAYKLLANGVIKSVEFQVAKPRSKSFAPDPNDTWTKEGIQFMNATGATRFNVKLATRSRTSGLRSSIKNNINLLMGSSLTKKLQVKIDEVDHPIDLFADRVFDKITIELNEGRPNPDLLFQEMVAAKKACLRLEAYLVAGDEALD